MKGEKMIKTSSSLGSRMRKRLSDITNLNSQHKSPFKNLENVANDCSSTYTKNYIDQILKENATMTKLIQEKDKIIESKALELQMVKVNLQRTQLQNYQLAQTNSQMLAELNMAKDRLKNLQHEFICKEALFKVMAAERKEVEAKPETKAEEPAVEQQPLGKNDKKEDNKVSKVENQVSKTKRGRSARSQSMGATTSTSQKAVDKEIMDNKRRCLRRQSMRLKPSEKQDDLVEIDVANNPDNQIMDSNSCCNSNSDVLFNNPMVKEGETKPEMKHEAKPKPEESAVQQPPLGKNDHKEENKVSKLENNGFKTRGPPARSQSMGATTSTSQQAVDKDIVENKRRCLRRQSMRLKSSEKQDELLEIDVANNPDNQTMDSNSRCNSNSDAVLNNEGSLSASSKHAGASIGRPRRATDKVSYKDPPLNRKMRRPV